VVDLGSQYIYIYRYIGLPQKHYTVVSDKEGKEMEKYKLLRDIRAALKITKDPYEQAWLLGAEMALMTLGQPTESMAGVMWNNQMNMLVGVK
jgi:hypothetical protein